eukprot:Nk52_evm78s226 gene=Nk52_evmTU78s226
MGTGPELGKDKLYWLIASQLKYDGNDSAANMVAKSSKLGKPYGPSDELLRVLRAGYAQLEKENENIDENNRSSAITAFSSQLDLDRPYEAVQSSKSNGQREFVSVFTTVHKGPVLTAAMSNDGKLAATGSMDNSIKILDVELMQQKRDTSDTETKPVLRALYDHNSSINTLAFNPSNSDSRSILAVGSNDCAVKFFDLSKTSQRRAFRTIYESSKVQCISYHPSGDFMLVGTEEPVLRFYDLKSLQSFACSNSDEYHLGGINGVDFNEDGSKYASCSEDGTVKIWDGVSSRCILTFPGAHSGREVSSLCFSRNGKYILTTGKDDVCRLWDVNAGRSVIEYKDARCSNIKCSASFSYSEEYVLCNDMGTNGIGVWDARTGKRLNSYQGMYCENKLLLNSTASEVLIPRFFIVVSFSAQRPSSVSRYKP